MVLHKIRHVYTAIHKFQSNFHQLVHIFVIIYRSFIKSTFSFGKLTVIWFIPLASFIFNTLFPITLFENFIEKGVIQSRSIAALKLALAFILCQNMSQF